VIWFERAETVSPPHWERNVERWLQHMPEPNRLWLAWQAPDPAERYRWAVGELVIHAAGPLLRYLMPGAEFEAQNAGRRYDEAARLGYAGYPAFNPRQPVHTDGVMEAFQRRIPPRNRADFTNYLSHFRIPATAAVSDWSLLGITEAKLPSDGFSLVDPLDSGTMPRDLLLEAAGFRHHANKVTTPVQAGQPLQLVPEPENQHDPNAVAIRRNGECLGYINRLQNGPIGRWLHEARVEAWVSRLNGKAGHPRLFIFIQIRPPVSLAA
jgi:HIRAN domain